MKRMKMHASPETRDYTSLERQAQIFSVAFRECMSKVYIKLPENDTKTAYAETYTFFLNRFPRELM